MTVSTGKRCINKNMFTLSTEIDDLVFSFKPTAGSMVPTWRWSGAFKSIFLCSHLNVDSDTRLCPAR